jgi:hypothetical protein
MNGLIGDHGLLFIMIHRFRPPVKSGFFQQFGEGMRLLSWAFSFSSSCDQAHKVRLGPGGKGCGVRRIDGCLFLPFPLSGAMIYRGTYGALRTCARCTRPLDPRCSCLPIAGCWPFGWLGEWIARRSTALSSRYQGVWWSSWPAMGSRCSPAMPGLVWLPSTTAPSSQPGECSPARRDDDRYGVQQPLPPRG